MADGEALSNDRQAIKLIDQLPERVSHRVSEWFEKTPEAIAVVETAGSWTYAQLAEATESCQQYFKHQQLQPGDRVIVIGENCRALIALLLAASEMNIWISIVNARLSSREIDQIMNDCEPRYVIYTVDCSAEAHQHATRQSASFEQHHYLGRIAFNHYDHRQPEPVYDSGKEQVFAMVYTSGTTGQAKGVMLTHHNIAYIASVSGAIRGLSSSDRVYAVLPISHVFGLASTCMGTLFAGGSLFLVSRFNAGVCLDHLVKQRITVLQGVPAMFAALIEGVKSKGQTQHNTHLRYMSCGGAPLDVETKRATEEIFAVTLNNGYGMTEASPTISQTRIDQPQRSDTTGRAIPGIEIRLVKADGSKAVGDEIGELWIRGPNVMKGYFRKPEQTAEVLTDDGWLNTQDLASLDTDGNITIMGRSKELIIRSGFNVYPAEVEAVLNAHPEVRHSAVIGQARKQDEVILAFVQPVVGALVSVAELREYCQLNLVAYKRPQKIILIDQLPASPSGKILKKELFNLVAGRLSSTSCAPR